MAKLTEANNKLLLAENEKSLNRLTEGGIRLGWRYAMAGLSLDEAIADWRNSDEKTSEQLQEKRSKRLQKERTL